MPRGRPKGSKNKPKNTNQATGQAPKGPPKHPDSVDPPEFEIDDTPDFEDIGEYTEAPDEEKQAEVSLEELQKEDQVSFIIEGTVAYKTVEKIGIRTKGGLRHMFVRDIVRVISRTPQKHWLHESLK